MHVCADDAATIDKDDKGATGGKELKCSAVEQIEKAASGAMPSRSARVADSRTVTLKDLVAVLERDPAYAKSTQLYSLYQMLD